MIDTAHQPSLQKGGRMSGTLPYRVNGITMQELRDRLISVIAKKISASFEASLLDDPSDINPIHHFEVRVLTFHADQEPMAVDLMDQYDRFFQIKFFEECDTVDFEIIT
jgi:hypothetical protein